VNSKSYLKYEQIINFIIEAVKSGDLDIGDALPSITEISNQFSVARETAVKSYKYLKQQRLIESKPGKGFFLISKNINSKPRVFLLLNDFNPYMQVLYNSILKNIGDKAELEVFFHHNNPSLFNSLVQESVGRYSAYLVKTFDSDDISASLEMLDSGNLLIIDRQEFSEGRNFIVQDFYNDFYSALENLKGRLENYNELIFVDNKINPHPEKGVNAFRDFCSDSGFESEVVTADLIKVADKQCYIVLNDEHLVEVLSQCRNFGFQTGKNVGILSYNDTPLKEFICTGISAVSVDFTTMGETIAEYALNPSDVSKVLKSDVIIRNSI
jgi:DNA-binding transcriptional regulator YhcF (GntR family)